jgi:outer membrane protein, heavy metal efflux system
MWHAFFWVAACGHAVEPGAERVGLAELVAEALQRNPAVAAAQRSVESARQRPTQVSSLPDPMVSVGYASTGSPRPFAGIGTMPVANAGFMVSQELPAPGKLGLQGDLASKEAEALWQDYQAVQLDVVSRVKQAYFRLGYVHESAAILERNLELLRDFLAVSEIRYSVGRAAQQDVFRAQTQISILQTRLQQLTQERRTLEAGLNALLNRPGDAPLGRPDPLRNPLTVPALDGIMHAADANSPVLRREQRMVERGELAVRLARKDYSPDYALSAGYYYMGRMPDMYEVRLEIRLPVYFWRKQRAGVAEQAADLRRARSGMEAANRTVEYQIREQHLAAETSLRLARMYGDTIVPQSELAAESSIAAYQTAAVDSLSVLTNLLTILEYQLNQRQELLNAHLALARLEELSGMRILPE